LALLVELLWLYDDGSSSPERGCVSAGAAGCYRDIVVAALGPTGW
jgi:hypothetical protein